MRASVLESTRGIRPSVRGKFLFAGNEKLHIKGATYGAFLPDGTGNEYARYELIDRDFAMMAANGFNAVRIPHTMPPVTLLDAALKHGLRVMAGLSAEQYIGYVVDRKGTAEIERLIDERVGPCVGHPAILCYALGNEIPASIARFLGRRKVERYLERLYERVKDLDPGGLVTYVNYPTVEYLQLPFLDLVSFNVYLETPDRLEAYLGRLQNIAGERPLLMSEVGLDSLRNGEKKQADVLDWQVRTAFAAGCAGTFLFAWTDEWYRGRERVEDWLFGLVDRERRPKPALEAVRNAYEQAPFPANSECPFVTVVVCTHKGHGTIDSCLEALARLKYPCYEVLVVDDGDTGAGLEKARQLGFQRIAIERGGLSAARNTGWRRAKGEIVAYIDDDAYADADWLAYLAATFRSQPYAGVGGPNMPPLEAGEVAQCVANTPGSATHVLFDDRDAEHIPGCNMAFKRSVLEELGGFDEQFRIAGDDVDFCWRVLERGWRIGFSPSAVVWHERRNSLAGFLRQQRNYGRSEGLLDPKWPTKYNELGHASWRGRIYERGIRSIFGRAWHIYYGSWGSAPFQRIYQPQARGLAGVLAMPEWYLVVFALAGLSLLSVLWDKLLLAVPFLVVAAGALVAQAINGASEARFTNGVCGWRPRVLTALLHLLQPLARLQGRWDTGLTAWRRRGAPGIALPYTRRFSIWTEHWIDPERRLVQVEAALRRTGCMAIRGGDYDHWDLEVRGGMFGGTFMQMAVEDHGSGAQYVRVRAWPVLHERGRITLLLFLLLAVWAAFDGAWAAAAILGTIAFVFVARGLLECGHSMANIRQAINEQIAAA